MAVLLIKAPAFASNIDLKDYGDFSSRSILMNKINGTDKMPQEIKDLLKEKKLSPTVACLVEQIKRGDIDNVDLLLKAKVNPNDNYYADYPIYYAAKYNKFDILKLLYENNAKLDRGFNSELFEAVKNKNNELAQFLLSKNAKVNYSDSLTNNTILYYAIKNNMIDVAAELINRKAKIDLKTAKLIKKKKLFNLIDEKIVN